MGCATALGEVFKPVNPVSSIDRKEFGEKIALSLDWHISPRKH